MLEQLRLILLALPWTGPAVVAGAVLAMLTMMVFARRRTLSDRLGFALLVWCLVIAGVVTLSPVRTSYFGVPSSGCDWSVWTPLAHQYWFSAGSRPPNVWLLFPAGIGVMLLDGFWRRFFGVVMLVALPPAIETIQDLYPQLKRSCSSQDVVDNWTGLVMGLAVGLVLAILIAIVRAIRRRLHARAQRRDAALVAQRSDGYDEFEPDGGAPPAPGDDGADLPLSGRARRGVRYDEFADFDDTPNSTRWYENEPVVPAATTPPVAWRPSEMDDGAAAPRVADRDVTQVIPRRDRLRRSGPDDDATRVIPRR